MKKLRDVTGFVRAAVLAVLPPLLVAACGNIEPEPALHEPQSAPHESESVDGREAVIEALVTAWSQGLGERPPGDTYRYVLEATLRRAMETMESRPGYAMILSRPGPGSEDFSVSLAASASVADEVMAFPSEEKCSLRRDAGFRDKRRWGQCIDKLMDDNGSGFCTKAETTTDAGGDGELGTDDDIFTTRCVERGILF